jgi:hypothetical protein
LLTRNIILTKTIHRISGVKSGDEMGGLTIQFAKLPEVKRNSPLRVQRTKSSQPIKTPADRILFLQRTIGNQAVQRLIKSGILQTKLKIGQLGDKYEQEADWVANAVMRMPQVVSNEIPYKQNTCPACREKELQRQPIEEEEEELQRQPIEGEEEELRKQPIEEEEEEELQANMTSGHIPEVQPDIESRIQSLKGGGHPLSEKDRAFFETHFGRDFTQVRVHTGTQAAEAARAVNAKAYTVGHDVVFGTGQYAPGTTSGQRLLAHELAHTIQQQQAPEFNRFEQLKAHTPVIQRQIAQPQVPVAGHLTQAVVDRIVSSIILSELDKFQNILIDVIGSVPLPQGQQGPPAPISIRVHVQAAYFINTATARAHYRQARRAAHFAAIIRALRRRREVSLIEGGRGPRSVGRAVELGKATPEDIKKFVEEALSQGIILRYAIRIRQLRQGQQLTDLGQRRLQTLIQRWVRHVGIGIDCSGFVQVAAIRAREAVRTTALAAGFLGFPTVPLLPEVSHRERDILRRGPRVRRPTDLRPGDAWFVGGHMRIVSTVRRITLPNGRIVIEFTTAESSGGSRQPLPGPVARTWRTRSLRAFNPITRVGHRRGAIGGTFHRIP